MTAETYQLVKSEIDMSGPIDFDKLRETTQSIGPLRMSQPGHPYVIEMAVTPCSCIEGGCGDEIVRVRRRNGVFSIRWLMSPEELLVFGSLNEFRIFILSGGMDDSSCERQIIKNEIREEFNMHHSDVKSGVCYCGSCIDGIGTEEISRRILLGQLAQYLTWREDYIEQAHEELGETSEDYVSLAFDLGYQMGRIYSEYQVKEDIEADALAGRNFESLKMKRAKAAGKKSSNNRQERIIALLSFMEKLASESPALLRLGHLSLAKLACEDAVTDNPDLWTQGSGQLEDYLGEIRRGEAGEDLKVRFLALFPPQNRRHQKTA